MEHYKRGELIKFVQTCNNAVGGFGFSPVRVGIRIAELILTRLILNVVLGLEGSKGRKGPVGLESLSRFTDRSICSAI